MCAEEIKKIISSQMPTEEKLKLADFVLDNSSSKADLKKNVTKIYRLCNAS
jgi:dephospho-CoA kinase